MTPAATRAGRLLVLALGAWLLSVSVADATSSGFRTKKGAAYCAVDLAYSGELTCWTPNDGFTVWMAERGRAHKAYRSGNKGNHPRGSATNTIRPLRFGETFRLGAYRCKSRRSGLRCRNGSKHGWWLGRYRGYRLF